MYLKLSVVNANAPPRALYKFECARGAYSNRSISWFKEDARKCAEIFFYSEINLTVKVRVKVRNFLRQLDLQRLDH